MDKVYFLLCKVYFLPYKVRFLLYKVYSGLFKVNFIVFRIYFMTDKVHFVINKVYLLRHKVYLKSRQVYVRTNKVYFKMRPICLLEKYTTVWPGNRSAKSAYVKLTAVTFGIIFSYHKGKLPSAHLMSVKTDFLLSKYLNFTPTIVRC
jgi:hypothetical protein